jgi:DNA-binding NarL/FixJ family response regulator
VADKQNSEIQIEGTIGTEKLIDAREWKCELKTSTTDQDGTIRLVLSDSSQMFCHALSEGLQRSCKSFKVSACRHSAQETIDAAAAEPHVMLISSHLQDGALSGFNALREIRRLYPERRVVMLLEARDRDLVVAVFRGGARGVVFREEPLTHLTKCVHRVHQGQIWASNSELESILEALAVTAPLKTLNSFSRALTNREQQIGALVGQGLGNREISRRLNLSEHTVRNYLSRIFEKLGASNRVEVALQLINNR